MAWPKKPGSVDWRWLTETHPPRLGGSEDRMLGFLLFATPSDLCHGPKKTTCAPEGPDLGELHGNLSIKGKEVELLEGGMTKAVAPLHELGLVIGRQERVLLVLLLKRRRWIEGRAEWRKTPGCSGAVGKSLVRLLVRTVPSLAGTAPSRTDNGA